jgi:transaldolase
MSTNERLAALSAAGVSIWLDDLSRERLRSGNLADLIHNRGVVGVTTNPTIFAAALANGAAYGEQVDRLAARGASVIEAIREITVADVRQACDLFHDTWTSTDGVDGLVSLEIDPGLARDTDATIEEALQLWKAVDRLNLLVKIPATEAGIPAITAVLAKGVSVNVTLIFSIERYRAVMQAYLGGLEQAAASGHDLTTISSVASFFVSRVDTEIDARLETIGTDEALALRARLRWRTPDSPTPPASMSSRASGGRPCQLRAHGPSGHCGPRPAPRTPPTLTPST